MYGTFDCLHIVRAVKKLTSNKAPISNGIPVSIIKDFASCYCDEPGDILKSKKNKFPNVKKIAKKSPVFKKLENT